MRARGEAVSSPGVFFFYQNNARFKGVNIKFTTDTVLRLIAFLPGNKMHEIASLGVYRLE